MTLSAEAIAAIAAAAAAPAANAAAGASATGLAGGAVELLDAGGAVLVSAPLGSPTSAGAVTTMGGFPKSVLASGSGTAASARYRTSAGGDWKTGMTVGLAGSGAQVVLSSLTITTGQTVTINSATLAHAAS